MFSQNGIIGLQTTGNAGAKMKNRKYTEADLRTAVELKPEIQVVLQYDAIPQKCCIYYRTQPDLLHCVFTARGDAKRYTPAAALAFLAELNITHLTQVIGPRA